MPARTPDVEEFRHRVCSSPCSMLEAQPWEMNPFQTRDRRPEWIPACARSSRLTVIAVLSLSTACGSSPSDTNGSGSAGTAGTKEGVGLAGGGASDAAGGHNGGGSAGASGGSAGVPSGSSGASGVNSDARGGSAGAGGCVAAAGSGGRGDAGAGGAGAGGASGGTGGAQAPACPAAAPVGASSCDWDGQVCFYEDCAGAGRTVATCQKLGAPGFSWSLHNTACGTVHCSGLPGTMTCASGQVCSVTQSGTISGMCAQSTCGAGPITCECAQASCTNCAIAGSTEQGFTVTCNNCPQGGCA